MMFYIKIGFIEFILKVDVRDFYKLGEIVEFVFNISKGYFFDKEIE